MSRPELTITAERPADLKALATIVRRLRAKIGTDIRYIEVIGVCSRAYEAIHAERLDEAVRLIVEVEDAIAACDARAPGLSQWYCVRTMVRQEIGAMKALDERGFASFMPMETFVRQTSKVREPAQRPLFPGYLFVLCREGDLAPILDLDRIQQFVRYQRGDGASRPMPFPLKAILGMQCEERAGLYDSARNAKIAYRPRKGDKVRITGGPWMTYVARVLKAPGSKRVRVLAEGPHGQAFEIDISLLSPA